MHRGNNKSVRERYREWQDTGDQGKLSYLRCKAYFSRYQGVLLQTWGTLCGGGGGGAECGEAAEVRQHVQVLLKSARTSKFVDDSLGYSALLHFSACVLEQSLNFSLRAWWCSINWLVVILS